MTRIALCRLAILAASCGLFSDASEASVSRRFLRVAKLVEDPKHGISGRLLADSNTTAPVAGAPVTLYKCMLSDNSCTIVCTDVTDAEGHYGTTNECFQTLHPTDGTFEYRVAIGNPLGEDYHFTGRNPGVNDVTPASNGTVALSDPIILPANTTKVVNAQLFTQPGDVTGTIFNDANNDGVQSGNETGVAGRPVTLMNGTDVVATTTTDSNGDFSFPNVPSGPGYTVDVGDNGANCNFTGSDVNSSGTSSEFTLPSGGTQSVVAGVYCPPEAEYVATGDKTLPCSSNDIGAGNGCTSSFP